MATENPTGAIGQVYGWDNAWQQARERLANLEAVLDPGTMRALEARGVGKGWQCLDVGAGGGSVTAWLCRRVGPTGRVVATDIDPRLLEVLDYPNLEVRRHDVTVEDLPAQAFDLVYTRLLPEHLPARDEALQRMVAELFLKVQDAFVRLWTTRGWDPTYGRRLFGRLRANGLTEVDAEGRAFMWQGGSAGARWMRLTYEQGRDAVLASGSITGDELDRVLALWDDPYFTVMSQLCMATWGQRPLG